MKLWDSLELKGRYSTLMGIVLFVANTALLIVDTVRGNTVNLLVVVLIYCVVVIFLMLPSKFTVKSKDIEMSAED